MRCTAAPRAPAIWDRPAAWVLTAALVACAPPPPATCNGAEALCPRRFDEVVYPTTHNAMSNEAEGWAYPNQRFGLDRQLGDGVRGLMLDVHEGDTEPMLCHGLCAIGSLPLVDGLRRIGRFLDEHRGEVVTILFESYVPAADVARAFERAGLRDRLHAQRSGEPWPTLRELIDRDRRLVVFTDHDAGGAYPWHHAVWEHASETPFAAQQISDFTCDGGRGDRSHPLLIFNHFLTRTFPVPDAAGEVNGPLLDARAQACASARGRLPHFVTVDFYDVGGLFDTVRRLNGL
jgi:hypothetical protein